MDLTVRPAVEADVARLHALHAAQNDFGGRWFTNPFTGDTEVEFEELRPAQRWLHGGPWMDPQLLSLNLRRYADAGGSVLVATRGGEIVGSVELWPSEEPLPFGAYLDIEKLLTDPPGRPDIARALVHAALQEVRARDLRALDIAPLRADGVERVFTESGFSLLAEHRTLHLSADRRPKAPEYDVLSTAPDYSATRDFLVLNHTEPANFRIGTLGNEWAAGLLKDVSHPFGGILKVGFAPAGVTGRVCTWLPDREAEIDLWASTASLGNVPWFRQAVAAAIDYVGRHHRVARYRTTVPSPLADPLRDLGFEDGTEPDPWLRRHIAIRNL